MRRAAWSIGVALLCGAAATTTTTTARAEVKLLDQPDQVTLAQGRAGRYAVGAAWTRPAHASGSPPSPIIHLALSQNRIDTPDCAAAEVFVRLDGKPAAAVARVEQGKLDCGGVDYEKIWLAFEGDALAALGRARRASVEVCGIEAVIEPRTVAALRRLVQRVLAPVRAHPR